MSNILIIAGLSAVGKTTLAHAFLEKNKGYELVRSATSRAPRSDGFDSEYIYLSDEEFKALLNSGGVIEHTEYAGALYGTPRSELERIQKDGKIPLLILDLEGVHTVVSSDIGAKACALYITAPMDILDKRLAERYGGDTEKRDRRMAKNREDHKRAEEIKTDFYRFIENIGDVRGSVREIEKAFAEFCKG